MPFELYDIAMRDFEKDGAVYLRPVYACDAGFITASTIRVHDVDGVAFMSDADVVNAEGNLGLLETLTDRIKEDFQKVLDQNK